MIFNLLRHHVRWSWRKSSASACVATHFLEKTLLTNGTNQRPNNEFTPWFWHLLLKTLDPRLLKACQCFPKNKGSAGNVCVNPSEKIKSSSWPLLIHPDAQWISKTNMKPEKGRTGRLEKEKHQNQTINFVGSMGSTISWRFGFRWKFSLYQKNGDFPVNQPLIFQGIFTNI